MHFSLVFLSLNNLLAANHFYVYNRLAIFCGSVQDRKNIASFQKNVLSLRLRRFLIAVNSAISLWL